MDNSYMKAMDYNEFSYDTIKRLVKEGQAATTKYSTMMDLLYSRDFGFHEWEYIAMGFENPDWEIGEIKTFYRIGEPLIDDGGAYRNSYNHAADRPEEGVSVVTTEWLHSLKSVFFGTSDDKIEAKGVYKIRGFELPTCGGDDEKLIKPIDWAEKTDIVTREGLEAAVAEEEAKDEE